MRTAADRNLLFGILALQKNLISPAALPVAMNAWAADKSRSLGQILCDQNALSSADCAELEASVQEHLTLHGGDVHKSLATISLAGVPTVDGVMEALAQVADTEVQATLSFLPKNADETRSVAPAPSSSVGTSRTDVGLSDMVTTRIAASAAVSPRDASTSAGLRFRIVRPHARGGLGEVFVAHDEELHREVALKQIQSRHADDQDSRARFLLEAEITGRLEHPGIVPVYGLGQHADGRPYYAMRFIKGDSLKDAIAKYHSNAQGEPGASATGDAGTSSLELRKLLGRFIDVCEAIQYAHDRGVLHRDLKPGNVMLGKYGETLVVDWGLAKVSGRSMARRSGGGDEAHLQPGSRGDSVDTLDGSTLGTPGFMSPEQAAGRVDELSPASDVYSLGATLYCILTGRPPQRDTDLEQVLQNVQAGKFPRPSLIKPKVDRALEAVCLKAMALAPRDRYASPRELAEDLERWLADKPVSACPEPWAVRTRRWLGRHRTLVAGTAAALFVGLVSLVSATILLTAKNEQLSSKHNELQAANGELRKKRDEVQTANVMLQKKTDELQAANHEIVAKAAALKIANEQETLAKNNAVKAAELERLAKIDAVNATQKALESARLEKLARELADNRLKHIEKANDLLASIFTDIDPFAAEKGGPLLSEQLTKRLLQVADQLDENAIGDPLTVARLQHFLGLTLGHLGERGKAIELLREVRSTYAKYHGPEARSTLVCMNDLANTYLAAGKRELALPLFQEAVALAKTKLGPDHPTTLNTMNGLAAAYQATGKLNLALPLYQEVLNKRKASLGAEDPGTLTSMNNLATAYQEAGKLDLALPLFLETLEKRKAKLAPDHPETFTSMNNLATAYQAADKLDLALPLFQDTLEKEKTRLGPNHPKTLGTMHNLALAYEAAGKLDLALPLFQEVLDKRKAKLGADHPNTFDCMSSLALAYDKAGKLDLALPLLQETLEKRKAKLGPDNPATLHSMHYLAATYRKTGKLDLALPLFQETLAKRKAQLGPDHADTLKTMNSLAVAYQAAGKLDLAVPLYLETLEKTRAKLGPDDPLTFTCMNNLAEAYEATATTNLALPLYREMLEMRKAKLGPDDPLTLTSMNILASAYKAAGKLDLALPLYQEALEKRKVRLGTDHLDTLHSMHNLAGAYEATGKPKLALPLYLETLEKRKARLGPDHPETLNTMNGLAAAYQATGNLNVALPLYQEVLEKQMARLGPDHAKTLTTMNNLATAYLAVGKLDLALPLFEETLKLRKARLGTDHPDTLHSMNNLAGAYWKDKQLAKSIPLFEEALKRQEAKLGRDHPKTLLTVANLGVNYCDAGRYAEGVPLIEEAFRSGKKYAELRWVGPALLIAYRKTGDNAKLTNLQLERLSEARKSLPKDSPRLADMLAESGMGLLSQKKWTEAEPLARECLAIRAKTQPDAWSTFNIKTMLGHSLLGQKKYQEAEPLLKEGYEGMKQREKTIPPSGRVRLTEALERLVQLYEATGNALEAERYRKELAARRAAEKAPKK